MNIKLSDHFTYRKLLRFTLPSIAMMIFTSIYGVVDGYFVSNFAGKEPFAAVNLIMPFIMIVATVGFMFGTGGTALVSKTFGEGDPERANRYFSLFVYTSFILGVLFSVLGIVFLRPIARLLGAEGTLLDNVRMGCPDADEAHVWNVLDIAQMREFAESHEDGLQRRLAQSGSPPITISRWHLSPRTSSRRSLSTLMAP